MGPEVVGRISEAAFIGTSSALLALCLIATTVRCYIRFRIQREFGWDDGFLIFGICCLISGMALLFTVMDSMYAAEAFVFGSGDFTMIDPAIIPKMIKETVYYRRMSAAALTLFWFSVCAVKFCFLAFFRRLINQMPGMIRWWWFTLAFNVVIACFGATVYFVSCPYLREDQIIQSMKCVQGDGLALALSYSVAQMALDIAGDIFILVIPIVLIWKIRINWTQKIALVSTLCLTIVMVILTIVRIAGLTWRGKLDSVWETYFMVIPAEVGLALVAITAFRALYISRSKSRPAPTAITSFGWYDKGKSAVWKIITKTTGKTPSAGSGSLQNDPKADGWIGNDIPHGTMTGMRTFIQGNGKTKIYATMDEEEV